MLTNNVLFFVLTSFCENSDWQYYTSVSPWSEIKRFTLNSQSDFIDITNICNTNCHQILQCVWLSFGNVNKPLLTSNGWTACCGRARCIQGSDVWMKYNDWFRENSNVISCIKMSHSNMYTKYCCFFLMNTCCLIT